MNVTVCFTGHRDIPRDEYSKLDDRVYRAIEEQILKGACVFRAGGALGFDTLAARNVLLLREKYPHIRLELILPCPTQTRGWPKKDTLLYEQILSLADSHRYISDHYWDGVYLLRNRVLVDGATVCIAYLKNARRSGSAYTAAYAQRQGLEFINLANEE